MLERIEIMMLTSPYAISFDSCLLFIVILVGLLYVFVDFGGSFVCFCWIWWVFCMFLLILVCLFYVFVDFDGSFVCFCWFWWVFCTFLLPTHLHVHIRTSRIRSCSVKSRSSLPSNQRKIIKYINQSDNSSQCMAGLGGSSLNGQLQV